MTLFLRRLGAWSALVLGALATVAAWRWMTRGAPADAPAVRLVGALLEQGGTLLPFAAYAAGLRTAWAEPGTVVRDRSWVLLSAAIVGAAVLALLAGGALLRPGVALPPGAEEWEFHNRVAMALFGAMATGLGARLGTWLRGQAVLGDRWPLWEPWALALLLLLVVLGGQGASWVLSTRYGVPAGPAVWGSIVPIPLTLWVAWVLPGRLAAATRPGMTSSGDSEVVLTRLAARSGDE